MCKCTCCVYRTHLGRVKSEPVFFLKNGVRIMCCTTGLRSGEADGPKNVADELIMKSNLKVTGVSSSALESSVLEIPKRVKWAKIIEIWTHPSVMVHGSRSHW